jgi:putative ABC transport system permease protein
MSMVALSNADLVLAALFLLVNGAISVVCGLRLELRLAIGALRVAAQVLALGFVLEFIFAQSSPWWSAAGALLMVAVAGHEIFRRYARAFADWSALGLAGAAMLSGGGVATLYVLVVLVAPVPWYAPRYLFPVLGLVLASTLTSSGLALQVLTENIERERGPIEARLAHGGTRIEAFAPLVARAMRAAVAPLLGTTSLAGIVLLPGFMAGQILAGSGPVEAARYHIAILFACAGAAGLGAIVAVLGGVLLLTDKRHRLRLDRLAPTNQ